MKLWRLIVRVWWMEHWAKGFAFVTFARDGSQYSYPMSRQNFEEWRDSGSLGGWFNEEIR
jgi:hypothetical protein